MNYGRYLHFCWFQMVSLCRARYVLFCSGSPASTFCPLTNQNSAQLPMQFILQLHRPVVLSKSVVSRIQKMTGDDAVPMCFAHHFSITVITDWTSSFWASWWSCLVDWVNYVHLSMFYKCELNCTDYMMLVRIKYMWMFCYDCLMASSNE